MFIEAVIFTCILKIGAYSLNQDAGYLNMLNFQIFLSGINIEV